MLRGCLRGALALALMCVGVGEGRAWDWTGPQVASTWSGPYAGFHLGGGFGHADGSSGASRTTERFDLDGALFGIHGGYNLQAGRIVLGFEADASKTFFKGRSDYAGAPVFDVNAATGSIFNESNYLVSVRDLLGHRTCESATRLWRHWGGAA